MIANWRKRTDDADPTVLDVAANWPMLMSCSRPEHPLDENAVDEYHLSNRLVQGVKIGREQAELVKQMLATPFLLREPERAESREEKLCFSSSTSRFNESS